MYIHFFFASEGQSLELCGMKNYAQSVNMKHGSCCFSKLGALNHHHMGYPK